MVPGDYRLELDDGVVGWNYSSTVKGPGDLREEDIRREKDAEVLTLSQNLAQTTCWQLH